VVIEKWIYTHIEEALFDYEKIKTSTKSTEIILTKAIEDTLVYYKGKLHETMMREYYFKATQRAKMYNRGKWHNQICFNLIMTDPSMGYVLRREIIYRVALVCASNNLYKFSS
jgi:hypothetical protein